MRWGVGGEQSRKKRGKLEGAREGVVEGREEGITQLHVGLKPSRACSRRHDLPAKGRDEGKEPNWVGGKIEYESLMRAISAPLPRPSTTRSLRRLDYQAAHLARISLYILTSLATLASEGDFCPAPLPDPPQKAFPIFDVTGGSPFRCRDTVFV